MPKANDFTNKIRNDGIVKWMDKVLCFNSILMIGTKIKSGEAILVLQTVGTYVFVCACLSIIRILIRRSIQILKIKTKANYWCIQISKQELFRNIKRNNTDIWWGVSSINRRRLSDKQHNPDNDYTIMDTI